jgi:hypothetical protein
MACQQWNLAIEQRMQTNQAGRHTARPYPRINRAIERGPNHLKRWTDAQPQSM